VAHLEVALILGAPREVGEFALLQNRLDGVGVGRPGGGVLAQAEVVQARADGDGDGAVERELGVRGVEVVGLGERVLVGLQRDGARGGRLLVQDHLAVHARGGGAVVLELDALLLELVGRDVERALEAVGEVATGLGADGHCGESVGACTPRAPTPTARAEGLMSTPAGAGWRTRARATRTAGG